MKDLSFSESLVERFQDFISLKLRKVELWAANRRARIAHPALIKLAQEPPKDVWEYTPDHLGVKLYDPTGAFQCVLPEDAIQAIYGPPKVDLGGDSMAPLGM